MGIEQIERICQILIRKIISPCKIKMPPRIDSFSFQHIRQLVGLFGIFDTLHLATLDKNEIMHLLGLEKWDYSGSDRFGFFVDDFYHMNRNDRSSTYSSYFSNKHFLLFHWSQNYKDLHTNF